MWWHLVRTLGNRCSTGFQVDDTLDFSNRGYSRQFFWEDVEKFTDNGDVLDSFKGGRHSRYSMHRSALRHPEIGGWCVSLSHRRGEIVGQTWCHNRVRHLEVSANPFR